jgi:hypothetical protein
MIATPASQMSLLGPFKHVHWNPKLSYYSNEWLFLHSHTKYKQVGKPKSL